MPVPSNGSSSSLAADALRRSVQVQPTVPFSSAMDTPLIYMAGTFADDITPWGTAVKARDKELRSFITVEPLFASALGTVIARNSAFSWKLEGPPRKVDRYHEVLTMANFGKGWTDLIAKVSMDLYTQDSGAFVEIIRERNSADAAVVGLASLDASRCYPTGIPETPVVYVDQQAKYHLLKWFQVIQLLEMPATYEGLPGLHYCALTRMLRAVRILRDISIYLQEKIGGRQTRAIAMLRGISAESMRNAVTVSQAANDAAGYMRYSMPVMVSSVDPTAEVDFKMLELASLPDNFDLDLTNKQYVMQLALAFLTDYQEFAPLPGGGLGTSSQSEILHLKNRGKGPGLFMKLITQAMNFFVLPQDLEFSFDEQDAEAEKVDAEVRKLRAEERALRITSAEISIAVAQKRALEAGDLTQEQFDELQIINDDEDVMEDDAQPEAQDDTDGDTVEGEVTPDAQSSPDDDVTEEEDGTNIGTRTSNYGDIDVPIVGPNRLAVEKEVADEIEESFAKLWSDLSRRIAIPR